MFHKVILFDSLLKHGLEEQVVGEELLDIELDDGFLGCLGVRVGNEGSGVVVE